MPSFSFAGEFIISKNDFFLKVFFLYLYDGKSNDNLKSAWKIKSPFWAAVSTESLYWVW